MSTGKRPETPRVDHDFHLRDLVETSWGKAIERAGREAARRYGQSTEDGAQEAWAIACEHWRMGYPPAEVLRLTRRDLDSRWSPLRHLAHDDPRASTRSRDWVPGGVVRRGLGVPITGLDRLQARLTASTLGPALDRLAVHAALRCPECGRAGHWEDAVPRGAREARRRARAWQLAVAADAGDMESGTPTGGGQRTEDQHAAAGITGTEPVWACGHPGRQRRHWTRTPVALLREGGDPTAGMQLGAEHGDTGRVERAFVALMDELAMERRRRPVFALLERPRPRRGGRRLPSGWVPMRGPSWTTIHADQEVETLPTARPDA